MWKEIMIENWRDFNEMISHFHYDEWIYRGQKNSIWDLQCSLYREIQSVNPDPRNEECVEIEKKMIEEFYSSSHLYSKLTFNITNTMNDKHQLHYQLEPLSVMQDYGAPTRLLDWTRSPYIAAFFALDGVESDFSIYALNVAAIEERNKARFGDIYNQYKQEIFSTSGISDLFIYPYDPYQKNERLRTQQGLFLVPSVVNKTMDDILAFYQINDGKLDGKDVTYKLIFNKENLQDYWYKLKQMNITHETIYPGLEGFCRSLKLHILL